MKDQVWLVTLRPDICNYLQFVDELNKMGIWNKGISKVDVQSSGKHLLVHGTMDGIRRLRQKAFVESTLLQEGEFFRAVIVIHGSDWIGEWRRVNAVIEEWCMSDGIVRVAKLEETQYGIVFEVICEYAVAHHFSTISGGRVECAEVYPLR